MRLGIDGDRQARAFRGEPRGSERIETQRRWVRDEDVVEAFIEEELRLFDREGHQATHRVAAAIEEPADERRYAQALRRDAERKLGRTNQLEDAIEIAIERIE